MKAVFFDPQGEFIYGEHVVQRNAEQIFNSKEFQALLDGKTVEPSGYLLTVCRTDKEAEELWTELNKLIRIQAASKKARANGGAGK